MVNNVIHATYTEMYDLNTVNGELSLLAIHTPRSNSLKRMFHGFYEQYKKMKVLGCNFMLQCPTRQELTPLDVGVATAGKIDPRAIMDPILFKACTGEGMNSLLDQIYNAGEIIGNYGSVDQHVTADSDQIAAYRSLLADDSFRKAHPQVGLTVMGLKPMVHKVVTTQPFKWSAGGYRDVTFPLSDVPHIRPTEAAGTDDTQGFGGQSGSKNAGTDPINPTVFVSNGLTEMPWLDTAFSSIHSYIDGEGTPGTDAKAYSLQTDIPRVYMGCIVLPPSPPDSGVNLYYRLTMVWHILFKDFRPSQDLMPVKAGGAIDVDETQVTAGSLSNSGSTYFELYHTASKLTNDYGSIDTTGVESIEKTLEKVN